MGDIMRQISIDSLLDWIINEYKNEGTVFGVRKFYRANPKKTIPLFGEKMETPCGPAAGPHTQLAQNIIAAYLSGSRFFELKTVQILDGEDLPVSKPCILAKDECYNCEWSTELRVPQAFEEYVKAWFVLKLFSKEWGLGDPDGFIFNMSVGYDLEGIKSPKVDKYITEMQDAENTPIWKDCINAAKKHLNNFNNIDEDYIDNISSKVSRSITISTLHGCPPDEIERIAMYFIEEKGLNTFIKCNPTLLGYEEARRIMDELGFDYVAFGDVHFLEDLQFEDAVPMFRRLKKITDEKGLDFGVKITNTFPVDVDNEQLPSEEMYMSGRSLFPLSTTVAKKLSKEFNGELQISYSGGADIFNIKEIFEAGIWPITAATTLLKPGGYQRMHQIAKTLSSVEYPQTVNIDVEEIERIADKFAKKQQYRKNIKINNSSKIKRQVPLIDCYTAPCRDDGGCPIHQDVPAYLRKVSEGKYLDALKIIVDKNPLPFITGTICAHPCMSKCSRQFYESSIKIREAKLEAANNAYDELLETLEKPVKKVGAKKTAVIGGGPAGISAGYLLAREGMPVTVFEKTDTLGGVCTQVVPEFRVPKELVEKDVFLAEFMGVDFKVGTEGPSIDELHSQGYENIIYAIGAWKHGKLKLEEGEALNSLEFLKATREDMSVNPYGKDIVVVGGGNTAMDCARVAKRLPNVETVSLVYRRDKRNMPADEEELYLALEDGVEFLELLAPVTLVNGELKCEIMKLGPRDISGRRSPVGTGEFTSVKADLVVAAVGEKVETEFYDSIGIETNDRGMAITNDETLQTNLKNVYVIGDANLGPATIVQAIADATKATNNICEIHNHKYEKDNINPYIQEVRAKRGVLAIGDEIGCPSNCLDCSTICEACKDVCPNRANVVVTVNGRPQIVHIDGMCNECGNCEVFCPYQSAPYKDKFTLFPNKEDFENSTNYGFYANDFDKRICTVRLYGEVYTVDLNTKTKLPQDIEKLMVTMFENYSYCFYDEKHSPNKEVEKQCQFY